MPTARTLSTADARRETVVSSAIAAFAEGGFQGTTIADVAEHAAISPAYVSKLYSKVQLFVAALDECYERILTAIGDGADRADRVEADAMPAEVLRAMGGAYAELVADRDLLMLQVHAQAATNVPEIAGAVRRGVARVTDYARSRSRAADTEVQQFIAFGQLCHLLTTIDAFDVDAAWAAALTAGVRHSAPTPRTQKLRRT
jgi:AcrR family transcriptional regulator